MVVILSRSQYISSIINNTRYCHSIYHLLSIINRCHSISYINFFKVLLFIDDIYCVLWPCPVLSYLITPADSCDVSKATHKKEGPDQLNNSISTTTIFFFFHPPPSHSRPLSFLLRSPRDLSVTVQQNNDKKHGPHPAYSATVAVYTVLKKSKPLWISSYLPLTSTV